MQTIEAVREAVLVEEAPATAPLVIDLRDGLTIDLRDPAPASGPPVHGEADTPQVSLAVIMPVFNEEATVRQAVADVLSVRYPCDMELIVVNDGSTDGTAAILAELTDRRLRVIEHPVNRGKGAALRTGVAEATASHVVPFDADLEYSASDLVRLLEPVMSGKANIVYGSRMAGRAVPHRSFIYAVGNSVMTRVANALYRSGLTDMHTCLKLVPRGVFRQIPLLEEGFGLDTELTAWLLRTGAEFSEVPVSYHSRSRAEGKKIGWRDSLVCFHILLLIRLEHLRP